MPFDKVDPKADFPAMEREVLSFWEETKAFDKLREINRGNKKWSFLDGPITANNPMGVHHAWGRTYKDIYQRFHAALGEEQRYQNGFDCQGLWVEVEVEKEHDFGSKKDIEAYGIDRFVSECKARASKFAAIQTEQSKRLGYWMDWDQSYYTMSDENNYGIWAFLKKCFEKGLIYKGKDVMPWCPRCGTGLSQMEMNEGYREVPHTSVFVKFPIKERSGESLLVWTTTPWTLSSNVAAAVKPEMTYVKVKQGDACCYVGKANFESARRQPVQDTDPRKIPPLMSIQAMFKNNGPFEIIEEVKGETLVGLTYVGPFDMLDGANEAVDAHAVIAWDQVTESEGTGIVHIAPGCGSEDYRLGKELGLPQIAPLFEDGRFRPEFGFLTGQRFDQVADQVVDDLKKRGVLFAKEAYHHRYPHCWRCKDELVYRLVDEWFINMNWREQIMESARQARWIPEWGLERELDWLRNMGDWMISKKRYWGLALPIWECHQCSNFEVIGGRDELKARAVSGWDAFEGHSPHRPWVDAVKIRCAQCGDENVTRVKDVGNPWLDASIVSLSTMGYFSDRKYWEQWFPAEFVVEALPGQFRNWFYALLAVSTMMVGRSPFKVLKGHGLVTDDEGKPMHKSDGNAIWFDEAAEQFGVDVMRWLYAATSPERNVLFGPNHCDETRREVILPWWNIYAFFSNLARADQFSPTEHPADPGSRTLLDRWILSDLHKLIRTARAAYADFDVLRVCTEAKRFIEVLSTWYVRRSRRRFYGKGWPVDKRTAYATLYEVLTTLNRVVAPIIPFMSERVYQNLVAGHDADAPRSVHHLPFPEADESLIDELLSAQVEIVMRVVSLGRAARKDSQVKVRQPMRRMIVGSHLASVVGAVEAFKDHLVEELNVKEIEVCPFILDEWFTTKMEPNKALVFQTFGNKGRAVIDAIMSADPNVVADGLHSSPTHEFCLEIDGESIRLSKSFFRFSIQYNPGFAGAFLATDSGNTIVLLDKKVTPQLKNEGIAREIIRNVQNLRKEANLDIADRIKLSLRTESPEIRAAIDQCAEYIKTETLAVESRASQLTEATTTAEVKIDGETVGISLERA